MELTTGFQWRYFQAFWMSGFLLRGSSSTGAKWTMLDVPPITDLVFFSHDMNLHTNFLLDYFSEFIYGMFFRISLWITNDVTQISKLDRTFLHYQINRYCHVTVHQLNQPINQVTTHTTWSTWQHWHFLYDKFHGWLVP